MLLSMRLTRPLPTARRPMRGFWSDVFRHDELRFSSVPVVAGSTRFLNRHGGKSSPDDHDASLRHVVSGVFLLLGRTISSLRLSACSTVPPVACFHPWQRIQTPIVPDLFCDPILLLLRTSPVFFLAVSLPSLAHHPRFDPHEKQAEAPFPCEILFPSWAS